MTDMMHDDTCTRIVFDEPTPLERMRIDDQKALYRRFFHSVDGLGDWTSTSARFASPETLDDFIHRLMIQRAIRWGAKEYPKIEDPLLPDVLDAMREDK